MIYSMTGYGKADTTFNGKKIHVEIKSLNSKALDLNTRIAPLYREKEIAIRKMIAAELERGKIDVFIWCEKGGEQSGGIINTEIAASYVRQICEISKHIEELEQPSPTEIWNLLVRLPEITQPSTIEELDEEEWAVVEEGVRQAIQQVMLFRRQEGEALERKFQKNISTIETLMRSIEPFEQSRVEKIKIRLEERLSELTGIDYDKNRLEQELIYYIEKLDINEEKQRLTNHLAYFRETMENGRGQGKKLGFIAQEMGREINTTGSKSNQAEMQNIVVKMKDELEQIKEQVLNVM